MNTEAEIGAVRPWFEDLCNLGELDVAHAIPAHDMERTKAAPGDPL
ncbi:MAG: hypothetical protein R3293_18360 [Candidatus Promineifilaceae bacterium]|nr:hypothetical protein [Candidatus Promineifilaceae bacterium]